MDGEIDGFKYASKWLAFVKSMNPELRQQKVAEELFVSDPMSRFW